MDLVALVMGVDRLSLLLFFEMHKRVKTWTTTHSVREQFSTCSAITIVHFLVGHTSISGAVNSPVEYGSIYAY